MTIRRYFVSIYLGLRCFHAVLYHVKKVLEYKFNENDKQLFEDYKNDLIEQGGA